MTIEFTLEELDGMSDAISDMIDNMEDDGDESFKPFLTALYSADRKIQELRTQLRNPEDQS